MMVELSKKWLDYLKSQQETGMGYYVVSVQLLDGRVYDQAVVVDSGHITQIKDHTDIPFSESDIAAMRVTHDKWNFQG